MVKAYEEKKEAKFTPVTIVVTLETQQELNLFRAIFNFAPFCNVSGVEEDWCKPIRVAAQRAGGKVDRFIPELFDKLRDR